MEPLPYWAPHLGYEQRLRFCMNSVAGVRSRLGAAKATIRNFDLRALPRKAQDTIMRFGASEVRRHMLEVEDDVRRSMKTKKTKTKKTKTKKTKTTKKTTRCIAALEWLAHSPPQVRELILAYTNNALSRQYRPFSAEATLFATDFGLLNLPFVSNVFLKRVFQGSKTTMLLTLASLVAFVKENSG